MTVFVIDTDVLANVQRARHAGSLASLGKLPVVITDVVWDELTVKPRLKNARSETVDEAENMLRCIAGCPTVLEPATPEAVALAALLGEVPDVDQGELSVIAYSLHHPNAVPVLMDKYSALRAIEELRGRLVFSLHGFLYHLMLEHGLAERKAADISSWFCASHKPARPPLWWACNATHEGDRQQTS